MQRDDVFSQRIQISHYMINKSQETNVHFGDDN